eukprot:IDg16640t1
MSKLVVSLCVKVDCLVDTRDSRNAPRTSEPPPFLSHDLKSLLPRAFCACVQDQSERLLISMSVQDIKEMGKQFLDLQQDDSILSVTEETGFEAFTSCWETVGAKYNLLRTFCGGFASVFRHFCD